MKTTEQHDRPTRQTVCPVVGIGASAGGLDAFRRLLSRLEASLGMAYVFVQHLDPTHQSLLPGLLSQMTVMPVQEVQEGMVVQPDTVYVVPAGAEISLLSGVFSLRFFARQEGQRAAIDHFFTSLAEANQIPTIGVVLSGTASDGVVGLQSIKAKGGIAFAQDEHSASFPQMPHNAIAAGCVDAVLSPEAIAEALGRLSRNQYLTQAPALQPEAELPEAELPGAELPEAELPEAEPSLTRLLLLLRTAYGVDFLSYKPNTLLRRTQHRMAVLSASTLSEYATYVGTHPVELETLFQQVLIPTTSFFRDPEVYATLTQSVFPELLERPGFCARRDLLCESGEIHLSRAAGSLLGAG